MAQIIPIRVFISSPGDVEQERVISSRIIERLAEQYAHAVDLSGVFWEHEPLSATDSFQAQITPPSKTDIAICILWSRLGTRLPKDITRDDGSRYDSGTEFEFEDAFLSQKKTGLPDLLVYRKTSEPLVSLTDEEALLDRIAQKRALDKFIDKWFVSDDGSLVAAFHPFNKGCQFEELLEIHLTKLIESRIVNAGLSIRTEGKVSNVVNEKTWQGSPFRGLETFGFEHAPIFFGRTRATEDIINQLRKQASKGQPFVLVLGMSGSGKSSVVNAGVLPMLTRPGVIEGVSSWKRCSHRPSDNGGDLMTGLAMALTSEQGLPELLDEDTSLIDFVEMLTTSPKSAATLIRAELKQASTLSVNLNADALKQMDMSDEEFQQKKQAIRSQLPKINMILVADQFEELFSTDGINDSEREAYVSALSELCKTGCVWILATLRSDFYARTGDIKGLEPLKKGDGQIDLLPPTANEISQMIRLPAQAAGIFFEEDTTNGERLDDVLRDAASSEDGSLPVLQFTLTELYKMSDESGMMTHNAYNQLGGLAGALSKTAEEVFTSLSLSSKNAFAPIFRALINVSVSGDTITKNRALKGDFVDIEGAEAFVDAFIARRLFVADVNDKGETIVSISHEALILAWQRIKDWLESDQELLRMQSRLQLAAANWQEKKQNSQLLLNDGKPLSEALTLIAEQGISLSVNEMSFVKASKRKVASIKRLKLSAVAALAIMLVVATSAAFMAQKQQKIATKNANEASIAKQQAEESDETSKQRLSYVLTQFGKTEIDNNPKKASLFLAASWQHNKSATNEYFLASALRKLEVERFVKDMDGETGAKSLISPDKKWFVLAGKQGSLFIYSMISGELLHKGNYHGDLITKILVSDDSKQIISASADNTIHVLQLKDFISQYRLKGHFAAVANIQVSTDGNYLLSHSYDRTARLWDLMDGKQISEISFKDARDISHSQILQGGKSVFIASSTGQLTLWDVSIAPKARLIKSCESGVLSIKSIALSKNEDRLFVLNKANQIQTFDNNCSLLSQQQLNENITGELLFTTANNVVVSDNSQSGASVKIYDINEESHKLTESKNIDNLNHSSISSLAVNNDGSLLAVGFVSGETLVINLATEKIVYTNKSYNGSIVDVAFSVTGESLVTLDKQGSSQVINFANTLMQSTVYPTLGSEVSQSLYDVDANIYVLGGKDGSIAIWNADTWQELYRGMHSEKNDYVTDIAISPNKKLLVVSGGEHAQVIDLQSYELLKSFDRLEEGNYVIKSVFVDDNTLFIAEKGSISKKGDGLWQKVDLGSGNQLMKSTGWNRNTSAISTFRNGYYYVTLSDGYLQLWYSATGKKRYTIKSNVSSYAFSSDHNRIAIATNDGSITINRHTKTGDLVEMDAGIDKLQSGRVTKVLFSHNQNMLASIDSEGIARIWNSASGTLISELKGLVGLADIEFSGDDRYVALASAESIVLIDTQTAEIMTELHKGEGPFKSVNFSNNQQIIYTSLNGEIGSYLLPALNDSSEALAANIRGRLPWGYGLGKQVPDDRWMKLALLVLDDALSKTTDMNVKRKTNAYFSHLKEAKQALFKNYLPRALYHSIEAQKLAGTDTELAAVLGQITPHFNGLKHLYSQHGERVEHAVFSPDDELIASGSWNEGLQIWSTATGQLLKEFDSLGSFSNIQFSKDGSKVLATSLGTGSFIWDVASGKELLSLPNITSSLHFDSTGDYVIGINRGRTPIVYDMQGSIVRNFPSLKENALKETILLSENLKILLHYSNEQLTVVDAQSHLELYKFTAKELSNNVSNRIRAVDISNNAQFIAVALDDANAVLIKMDSTYKQMPEIINTPLSKANDIAFNRDESYLLADIDNHNESWHITSGKHQSFAEGYLASSYYHERSGNRVHVTLTNDDMLIISELETGQEIASTKNSGVGFQSVTLSYDEKRLLAFDGSGYVRVFDIDDMSIAGSNRFLLDGKDRDATPFNNIEKLYLEEDEEGLFGLNKKGVFSLLTINTEVVKSPLIEDEDNDYEEFQELEELDKEEVENQHAASPYPITSETSLHGNKLVIIWSDGRYSVSHNIQADGTAEVVLLKANCGDAESAIWHSDSLVSIQCTENHLSFIDVDTKKELAHLEDTPENLITSTLYIKEANRLIVGHIDSTKSKVIDSQNKISLYTPPIHKSSISAVASDNNLVASADIDGQVRIWELVDGKSLINFDSGKQKVEHLAFANNATMIVVISVDGNISLWDTGNGQLINRIKSSDSKDIVNYSIDEQNRLHILTEGNIYQMILLAPESRSSKELMNQYGHVTAI